MTVIAYRDGIMAADTAEWCGNVCTSFATQKVYRAKDGSLIGCAGAVAEIAAFCKWFDGGQTGEKPFDHGKENENAFGGLVVRRNGEIWKYDAKCRGYPVSGDMACEGCHEEFLLSALLAGMSASEAVAHAIKYCSYAGGAVFALSLAPADG